MANFGHEVGAVAAAVEVAGSDGSISKRVHLIPMGTHLARDGRGPFRLEDKAHGERVIAATRKLLGKSALMIDYDHQLVHAPKPGVGGTAPASGWVETASLTVESDGIWGDVEWTAAAQAKLRDREYRYLSPYFLHDKASGRVTRIVNAALVNYPALELAAVASAQVGETQMDFTKIAEALGLGADAGEEQILASIETMKAAPAAALAAALAPIATTLGLDASAPVEEVAATAATIHAQATGEPDPARYVPIEVLTAANARLEAISLKDGETVVDAAIASGKLTPANRDWGLASYRASPEGFVAAMGNQPAVLKPGEEAPGGVADEGGSLSDEERALCSSLGWDEAAFLAGKKAEAEGK